MILVVYGAEGKFVGGGEGSVCADEWQAVIRKEDVRATEKEKVVTAEGFRVGDVVRGVVVCLDCVPSVSSVEGLYVLERCWWGSQGARREKKGGGGRLGDLG